MITRYADMLLQDAARYDSRHDTGDADARA